MRRDPGLQPERTRLAWRRTVLAMGIVALLAARLAAVRGAPLGVAAAVALWLAALVVGHRRITAMAPRRPAAVGRSIAALTTIVVLYALLSLLALRAGR